MCGHLYSVLDLPPERFQQAYALIQASGLNFTLGQWLEYAERLQDHRNRDSGILSALSSAQYIHALAGFQICPGHSAARVIQVENLCVLNFLNESVGSLLMKALEHRARAESCSVVRVRAPEGSISTWLRPKRPGAMLQDLGYTIDGEYLMKQLNA